MKRRPWLLALATLCLTACSNNPGISPGPSGPNPSSVLVTVTVGQVPTSNISVTLSTQLGAGAVPPAGSILQTVVTGDNGQVTIVGVPSTGTLCLSASQSSPGYAAAVGACHSQPIPAKATLNFPKT